MGDMIVTFFAFIVGWFHDLYKLITGKLRDDKKDK